MLVLSRVLKNSGMHTSFTILIIILLMDWEKGKIEGKTYATLYLSYLGCIEEINITKIMERLTLGSLKKENYRLNYITIN